MNKETAIRGATLEDIPGVLALQAQYLYANLTDAQRLDGFVTTPFTVLQLEAVIAERGLFIALDDSQVVAYVFAASWDYFFQWEMFREMSRYLPDLPPFHGRQIGTSNSFQYGPVCIDLAYRGGGLLQRIFETMRVAFKEKYPISLTFINLVNERSMRAHTQKLNWEVVGHFDFNDKKYAILAFDMETKIEC